MKTEELVRLPLNAEKELVELDPYLRQTVGRHVLNLSHETLHRPSEGRWNELRPIAAEELDETHQPHIDKVVFYMGQVSAFMGAAHERLIMDGVTPEGITLERLNDTAKHMAIDMAKKAKEGGDPSSAIEVLGSVLAMESLDRTNQDYYATTREIVAQGLARELVHAAQETAGIVSVGNYTDQKYDKDDLVPLNARPRVNVALLEIAATADIGDNFSHVTFRESEDTYQKKMKFYERRLATGDFLALAEAKIEDDRQEAVVLATKAVDSIKRDWEVVAGAQTIARSLTVALELGVKKLPESLDTLRASRLSGNAKRREFYSDNNHTKLDGAIVKLIQDDQLELAKSLVSSSPQEMLNFSLAVQERIDDPAEAQYILRAVDHLQSERRAELVELLQYRGADSKAIERVIQAIDPESAIGTTFEFWQAYDELPEETKEAVLGYRNLTTAVESLTLIETEGLTDQASLLLPKIENLEDHQGKVEYLISYHRAYDIVMAEKEQLGEENIDLEELLRQIRRFEDPIIALETAKKMYGSNYGTSLEDLQSMCNGVWGDFVTASPEYFESLVMTKKCLEESGIGSELSLVVGTNFYKQNPLGHAADLASALDFLPDTLSHDEETVLAVVRNRRPKEFAKALVAVEALLEGVDGVFAASIKRRLDYSNDPPAAAMRMVRANRELMQYGLDMEMIGLDKFDEFTARYMGVPVSEKNEQGIATFCKLYKVSGEYKDFLTPDFQSIGKNIEDMTAFGHLQPNLEQMPELQTVFNELGIDSGVAKEMFASWLSYDALMKVLYDREQAKVSTVVDQAIIESALKNQVEIIKGQVEALIVYADKYGQEELHEVMTTFGIYNFYRFPYETDQLHDQLVRWNDGSALVKNVIVKTRSDWNGAAIARDAHSTSLNPFDDDVFHFEVGNTTQLAQVAVAVGNRDRQNGRDPQVINSVENFLIQGHANATLITLGVNEYLNVQDYLEAEAAMERAKNDPKHFINARENNYRRHLGNNFRLILRACEAAGESFNRDNIASAISKGHSNIRVEASPYLVYGIIIESDGSIAFEREKDKVASTVYGG